MSSRTKTKMLRGRLLIKGFTVREFSARYRFNARTVKAAIRGERSGPISQKILEAISNA